MGSLSSRSLAAEHCRRRPLRWRMESGCAQLGFHQPRQREIEVIAAQQQVLAHRRAREIHQVALARDADQAEIAGPAAHVADQHDLAVEELLARLRQVVRDPGIERRRRLFEQRQPLDAGLARGHHGQFTRFFVEGRRNGEDDVLLRQRRRLRAVPFLAELGDEARRNLHRRKHPARFRRIPRQDFGGAVDIRIGKPGLGRMHQPRGHQRALFARVQAHRLPFLQKQERGQGAARLHAPRRHQLRRLENMQRGEIAVFGLTLVNVGQGGIGGAEIDAYFHGNQGSGIRAGTEQVFPDPEP